jgi:hypothetical protein
MRYKRIIASLLSEATVWLGMWVSKWAEIRQIQAPRLQHRWWI